MTLDDRVRALASLHLTPRQTRFVALVALHSGYCLRRQYLTFAGLHYGKSVREFLDGLVTRGFATRFAYRRDRGYLYHLSARSLYRAINQEENRNRRHTSPALIARKLMVLDYVLGHHEREWYATEQDKVALFTARFDVPIGDLPHRVYNATDGVTGPTIRYFVQKLPIYLEGEPPVVHLDHVIPLRSDRDGHVIEDGAWGIYYKIGRRGFGVQGGGVPIRLGTEVELEPYGHDNPEHVVGDEFTDYFTSGLAWAHKRFRGKGNEWHTDPHGGIGAFTPDNYPIVDFALPNAYMVMDSNHGFKMIGLGKLVANDILGGGESRLDAFRLSRYEQGVTHAVSNSPYPWN